MYVIDNRTYHDYAWLKCIGALAFMPSRLTRAAIEATIDHGFLSFHVVGMTGFLQYDNISPQTFFGLSFHKNSLSLLYFCQSGFTRQQRLAIDV